MPSVYRSSTSSGSSCTAVWLYEVPAINPSGRSAISLLSGVESHKKLHSRVAERYHSGGRWPAFVKSNSPDSV